MRLGSLLKRAERMLSDNSPLLLTAVGVVGTVTTAFLTGKASVKAYKILETDALMNSADPLDARDKINLCWKLYIPAATTGTLTVAAIIFANRIGSRRAAALALAYSVSEKAFDDYRSKIVQRLGDKKEQSARDELAQERVDRDPVTAREVIITGGGEVLCYEPFTGRYFHSDMETLRRAENHVNHQVLQESYASLSDLYDWIGLPHTAQSDEIGWNLDKLLELQYSAVMSEDNRPCISVTYSTAPIRHFYRLS